VEFGKVENWPSSIFIVNFLLKMSNKNKDLKRDIIFGEKIQPNFIQIIEKLE
jgi:hypothetical protein